jgi:sterol desaturase/sphingolipid hydroxylase (fatty acid hydroxylase superfamily)
VELTVAAVPVYFGSMGAEYRWLRRHAAERGPTPADYERRDTIASLSMGVASLVAPIVMPRVLRSVTPGKGRGAKVLVGVALGAATLAAVADVVARREVLEAGVVPTPLPDGAADDGQGPGRERRRRIARAARRVAGNAAVAAFVAGGTTAATAWASKTTAQKMFCRRLIPDLGTGTGALALAVVAWDFIYYWNHRFMHESRFMWAIHVVHHSSEHYNLSTALRQPVADAFGTFVPYGALGLLGIEPTLIEKARGVNLLYQFFIHTDTVRTLGPLERVFNTPSHHRVHHGSNRRYLDRNHGSILIVWDKLFGTFEPEGEPVVYGLTKNINTFNPARIATHEYLDMFGDVERSDTWAERFGHVVRGPGWGRARAALAPDPASLTA